MAADKDRASRGRIGAHISWARTTDPSARTAPGRAAANARFEKEVDPEGTLPADERRRRADHLMRAHMSGMARKSVAARRARKTS